MENILMRMGFLVMHSTSRILSCPRLQSAELKMAVPANQKVKKTLHAMVS